MYGSMEVILSLLAISTFTKVAAISGTFWHITDIHLNKNYSSFGNPKKQCHKRPGENNSHPIGQYGDFLCDSNAFLLDATIKFMAKQHQNPDFILWTGDNMMHLDTSLDESVSIAGELSQQLMKAFPGVQIYPTLGNHDTYPSNVLDPNNKVIYKEFLKRGRWAKLLPKSTIADFKRGGYYSHVPVPGLRVINLNSVLWYFLNPKVKDGNDANQMKFLKKQLRDAGKKREKVYIVGHISPGYENRHKRDRMPNPLYHICYLSEYLEVIRKYSQIIAGQFFSHLHNDMFQIYKTSKGRVFGSGLLAGSVTPWHFEPPPNELALTLPVNPTVRLLRFDIGSKIPLDYNQYFFDLSKANQAVRQRPGIQPTYEELYNFREEYGLPDLSSKSLELLFRRLKISKTAYNRFFLLLTGGKKHSNCSDDCRGSQLCSMGSIDDNVIRECFFSIKSD